MTWLVSEGRVLASAEVAADRRSRARGLLGRDGVDGALVIDRCRWVHTIGMRFPIDVAYLDAAGTVVKTVRMRRRRIGLPVFGARCVVEANAGAFARWGVGVGCIIEIRGDDRAPQSPTGERHRARRDGSPDVTGDPGGTSDAACAGTDAVGEADDADHGRRRPDHDGGARRLVLLTASR